METERRSSHAIGKTGTPVLGSVGNELETQRRRKMASKATEKTKAGGKKMNEVKPLAYEAFLKMDGITGESQ